MQYPAAFIDRVKSHFRLSEVIGKRINVRRHGREFQALCPFHNEKTPSFTINDEKGFYYCFGCGAKGDSITFLMEHDRLTYPQAIETLAHEAGITIPKPDAATAQRYSKEEKLFAACQSAAEYFSSQLQQPVANNARQYLRSRGITEAAIQQFQIGYAPMNREGLKIALTQGGHSEQILIEAGLLIKVENKPTYDRFRGRVMFPIRAANGKVIAFGGRLLEAQENAPKYLNSPETPLFNKRNILFNLDKIKQMRDLPNLVVVEGYMDVISLHINGLQHAVAPLGTAFSEDHLHLLWRFNSNPILCFDGDKAGQKAMLRAAELALPLITSKLSLRFCGLPNGEDPDSFIRSSGLEAMRKMLERSLTMSELLWNCFIGTKHFSTPESLAQAEAQLLANINKISDESLKRRIVSAYKSRLWHISKQQYNKSTPITNPIITGKVTPLATALEQVFALIIHFPALLLEVEIEHALYHWQWQGTTIYPAISKIISESYRLSESRQIMREFLQQNTPEIATYMQNKYDGGIISSRLYQLDEKSGTMEAKLLFLKLQQKIEQQLMMEEMHQMVKNHAQANDGEKLIEMIKMQQKKILQQINDEEEPYI
jgi:DNA primase catalytic core